MPRIGVVSKRLDLAQTQFELMGNRDFCRFGNDQMGFDACGAQQLKYPHAINGSRGAGDPHNQAARRLGYQETALPLLFRVDITRSFPSLQLG